MEINAFRGLDGQFDRQNYQLSLEGAGYTEAEFEAAIRAESARTLLQGAVLAGNTMDNVATETVLAFLMETRDFTCLLYTSPSPRDLSTSRMPSSA